MVSPRRPVRKLRIKAGSHPEPDFDSNSGPQPKRLPGPFLRIEVTLSLPRELLWLLAGVAIANLRLPDRLLENADLLLRALLHG